MNRKRWVLVSGGQTGVERAALVCAMSFSITTGGWMPKGQLADGGVVPEGIREFGDLRELSEEGCDACIRANVRDSEATLILLTGASSTGGTARTEGIVRKSGKPCAIVDLDEPAAQRWIYDWMMALEDLPQIKDTVTMYVTGPCESRAPGIFKKTKDMLMKILWGFRAYSGGDITQFGDDGEIYGWIDAEYVAQMFDVKKNAAAARG